MPQSGSDLEQPSDEGALSPDVIAADVPNLPFSDHRHGLYAGQGPVATIAVDRDCLVGAADQAAIWDGPALKVL
jgi:hypothetical protein